MDTEYVVALRENAPTAAAVVVNNTGVTTITDYINYGILIAVSIQIIYSLWKFQKEVRESREKKRGVCNDR